MSRFSSAAGFGLGLLLALSLIGKPANAGLNSGAVAHLYWQMGDDSVSVLTNSGAGSVQVLLTVTGVSSFRGADVQLQVRNLMGLLPGAWQIQPGGCNEDNGETGPGDFGAHLFPSIWTSGPRIPGLLTSQNSYLYPGETTAQVPDAFTALAWLSAAGGAGVPRNPEIEYAVFSLRLQLEDSTRTCWLPEDSAGNPADLIRIRAQRLLQAVSPGDGPVSLLDSDNSLDTAAVTGTLRWSRHFVPDTLNVVGVPGRNHTSNSLRMAHNPARGQAVLRLHLAAESDVTIEILDLQGRRVPGGRWSKRVPSGDQEWKWPPRGSASGAASGIYFARVSLAGASKVQRFVLLR